jgi:hypothetical protein
LVDDDTYNKAYQELKNHGNLATISIKLKAIIAAKTHSITQVADVNESMFYTLANTPRPLIIYFQLIFD